MRAEQPDNRLKVEWKKAVTVRHFAHLYSLACYALEDAGRMWERDNLRRLVNEVSKSQQESLKYIEQYVRFG